MKKFRLSVSKKRAPEVDTMSVPRKYKKLKEDKERAYCENSLKSKNPKPIEIIPLLKSTIGNILNHKNPNMITSEDYDIIENCLEQLILRDVSMEVLIDSGVGVLIKDFYEFVHVNPQLKVLDLITRCAFRKLKKRVCEALFGVRKILPFAPDAESDIELKSKSKSSHKKRHTEEEPKRIEKSPTPRKRGRRMTKETLDHQKYELMGFADSDQVQILQNLHKEAVNPKLSTATIKDLTSLFIKRGVQKGNELAQNVEHYMRIFDPSMKKKYLRWYERIKSVIQGWKDEIDKTAIIERLKKILPVAPPNIKLPL